MALENRIHARWDRRLYPEVETSDIRKFFAAFGAIIELERKSNRKKGPVPFCSVRFSSASCAAAALAHDSPQLEDGTPLTLTQEKDAEEVRKKAEKRRLEEDVEREIKRRREEQEAERLRLLAVEDEKQPKAKLVYLAWKEAKSGLRTALIRTYFADFGTIVGIERPALGADSLLPPYCTVEFLHALEAKEALAASATPSIAGVSCLLYSHLPPFDKYKKKKADEIAAEIKREEAERKAKGQRDWEKKAYLNPRYVSKDADSMDNFEPPHGESGPHPGLPSMQLPPRHVVPFGSSYRGLAPPPRRGLYPTASRGFPSARPLLVTPSVPTSGPSPIASRGLPPPSRRGLPLARGVPLRPYPPRSLPPLPPLPPLPRTYSYEEAFGSHPNSYSNDLLDGYYDAEEEDKYEDNGVENHLGPFSYGGPPHSSASFTSTRDGYSMYSASSLLDRGFPRGSLRGSHHGRGAESPVESKKETSTSDRKPPPLRVVPPPPLLPGRTPPPLGHKPPPAPITGGRGRGRGISVPWGEGPAQKYNKTDIDSDDIIAADGLDDEGGSSALTAASTVLSMSSRYGAVREKGRGKGESGGGRGRGVFLEKASRGKVSFPFLSARGNKRMLQLI